MSFQLTSEYKEVFLEELDEQLQIMDDNILKLEQDGESESVIQSLFRAAHTIKGSSATMGFSNIKTLTHEIEHLMDQVRKKALKVSGPFIDLLFTSLDCLKLMKDDIVKDRNLDRDITSCIHDLHAFIETTDIPPQATDMQTVRPELNLDTHLRIQEAQASGHQAFWVQIRLSPECVILGARAYVIINKMSECGDVLLSFPDPEDIREENGRVPFTFSILYVGKQTSHEIQGLISGFTDVLDVSVEIIEPDAAHLNSKTEQAAIQQSDKPKSQTIRVSVDRLDHLMNLVGELVIDQTRIHQVKREMDLGFTSESVHDLGQVSDHLTRIIGDLQESVMKARMLPIEQLLNRFPRMVRDLSRDLGKEIDLQIEGKETELDRTLIEEIADPLIHLVRNAIDHGIEKPDMRKLLSKNRTGNLIIRASHEDNQVIIYVEDDGAGIDAAAIRMAAVRKGVIDQEEAERLTDHEAVGLIFRPGFSTASTVSDVSGRGVGMDIVRSHIEKLNGLIDIHTVLGQGTQFKIKLPLTLAIIAGLLVRLNKQTYIIPMSNITEIMRVTQEDIQQVRGIPAIVLRNQVIPVVWLHDQFHIPAKNEAKRHIPIVIVGSAEKRLALAVDELLGNQEIVIKSLGSFIGKVAGIAGATILGDGRVALILEVPAIINKVM